MACGVGPHLTSHASPMQANPWLAGCYPAVHLFNMQLRKRRKHDTRYAHDEDDLP